MGLRRFGGPGMHGMGGVPLSSLGGAVHGGYAAKVLATGPIAYWPLWEASGTTARCLVNPAQNGTYSSNVVGWPPGTGMGDGNTAPFFDGTNDYVNIWSAALAAAFSGLEGTVMIWGKVANVGAWTDGTNRDTVQLRADFNNRLVIYKSNVNNTMVWNYVANADNDLASQAGLTTTGWMCFHLTWSDSGNQGFGYLNGVQAGLIMTPIGTWANALVNGRTNIGCDNTTGPTVLWHGWLAHCAIWTRVLSPAELVMSATV